MHARALPALALAALALAASGCLDAAPAAGGDLATDPASEGAAAFPPLGLAGRGCLEGGGHSVHPKSLWEQGVVRVVPDPWVPADVIGDVGPQLAYSEFPDPMRPVPEEGNTMGNYHATMWCDSWTLDGQPREGLFVGFVGMKVEAPPFDPAPEGVTHHYVVTVIASDDDEVLARLRAAGFAALEATAAREELPDGTLRIRMWTEGNGDYDSLFKPKPFGGMQATHVRLWFQQGAAGHGDHAAQSAAGGAGIRPIALDLLATGGEHLVADAQGYFSHSGTDHHDPLPGAYGHTAAILYRGFDRTFEWGPRPDVTLDEAYDH